MQSLRTSKRTFKHIDKDSFGVLQLYKAYIRPHHEYSVQAWNPFLQKDIKSLENVHRSVHRRATKMVPTVRNKSYNVRLNEMKLFPLEVKRIRGDLIEAYNIFHRLDHLYKKNMYNIRDSS